ncbi:DUF3373 family protein [bacterium]|nr:DUF3373 family protein [bacterium]
MKTLFLTMVLSSALVSNVFAEDEELKEEVKSLDERLSKVEVKTANDRVNFNIDFRTRYDYINYDGMQSLPEWAQMMMALWSFDRLAVAGTQQQGALNDGDYIFNPNFMAKYGTILQPMMPNMVAAGFVTANELGMYKINTNELGKPYFSDTFTATDLAKYQMLFSGIAPEKYNKKNKALWTNRLKLGFDSKVDEHLSFAGRLSMYKAWGDATGYRWFNGSMSSVNMDGNDASIPTDDKVRVDRAYFVYSNKVYNTDYHWHFSFGRRPATAGMPNQNRENWNVATGSPLIHIINWQFDGASLGLNFGEDFIVPGHAIKLCYGKGYEGGWGNSASYSAADTKDVEMMGFIWTLFDNSTYKLTTNYAYGDGITDGFTGVVITPFTINGLDINSDGNYDEYYFTANDGGYISRFEARSKIGNMHLGTLLAQYEGEHLNAFVSYAFSKTIADGKSMNAMMQFMGTDGLLNSFGTQKDRSGNSLYAGIIGKIGEHRIGFEYNQGSKYWFNFSGAEDSPIASKLAVRGKVYEGYWHIPIHTNRFFMTIAGTYYDYDYTGSGNPMGEPKKISQLNGLDSLMPVVDKVYNFSVGLSYRY